MSNDIFYRVQHHCDDGDVQNYVLAYKLMNLFISLTLLASKTPKKELNSGHYSFLEAEEIIYVYISFFYRPYKTNVNSCEYI